MIIDMEHHFYGADKWLRPGRSDGRIDRGWIWTGDGHAARERGPELRIGDHLDFMDRSGIDVAVLTTNAARNLEQVKTLTEACAKAVKQHPGRFVGFAPVDPLGGRPALEEMERSVKDLGMKGVHISCRPDKKHMDSKEMWPFYEKVSALGVPIDVHVEFGTDLDFLDAPYALRFTMAREYIVCAETLRVCLGGVLEQFPDLVFIVNHLGGGVSAVMERVDVYVNLMGDSFYRGKPPISKPWRQYFDKLYFSMAGREIGMAAVKCALTTISPKKLMFATDWPPNFENNPRGASQYVEAIRRLDLPREDVQDMLGGNAARLLKIQPA
ncbi:MAG: amidohydrolase family protein [Burkholderiales bacterium]|nr:amidohydrolase family protein [Burkholderiales bacterium]